MAWRSHGVNNRDLVANLCRCYNRNLFLKTCSVAVPGCLSRIPNPDFYPFRILDPGSRIPDSGSKTSNKREGWKKFFCHNFLCGHKFHKIGNYLSFEVPKTKIWANFQGIIEHFTKNFSKSSQKYGFGIRDPGSGKNLFRSPDPGPGVKKAPEPWSWIRIRNTVNMI